MKKSLLVALMVLLGVAVAGVAAAQTCQYHNLKVDFTTGTQIDPGSYDVCIEVSKVAGTLNGSYTVCWTWAEFIPSDVIYGDGWSQIEAEKYYSRISTKKGDIEFIEWAWYDGDFGLETGFSKVVGGTGDFEGSFGTLSWTPRYPNLGPVNWLEGYVCTP